MAPIYRAVSYQINARVWDSGDVASLEFRGIEGGAVFQHWTRAEGEAVLTFLSQWLMPAPPHKDEYIRVVPETNYRCKECGKSFVSLGEYFEH